jgi:hypothetical protein
MKDEVKAEQHFLHPSSFFWSAARLFHKWKSLAAFAAFEKSKRALNSLSAMRVFHPRISREMLSFFVPHDFANEGLAISSSSAIIRSPSSRRR